VANALDNTANGGYDWFMTRLATDGQSIVSSTYIGGSDFDAASTIVVGDDGLVYLNGGTRSSNFPKGLALDSSYNGSDDGFILLLDSTAKLVLYGSFFGGSSGDGTFNLVMPSDQQLVAVGQSSSANFPVKSAWDTTWNGGYDITLSKFDFRCCQGYTGNVDCDLGDGCDISDLSALIDNLYITFTALCCMEEANVDGQPGIDISDLSALIDYLYISFTPPAACP
jgi:hypothetical protein